MSDKEILALIGVAITFIGYAAYITSILRGNTKPHPFSWTIWGILTAIGFFAQIWDHAGPGAWITGTTAAISFVIVALSYFKFGHREITRSDWIMFVAAIAAIPIWMITNNPLWSVILITVIDAIGFYPTFRKTWTYPHQELAFHYIVAGLKFVLGVIALNNYTVITVLYPASLVLMNAVFLLLLYGRRFMVRNSM